MDKMDAVRRSIEETSGERPFFFDNPDTDRLIAMILGLSGELATVYERLDNLEQILMSKKVLSDDELESYLPDQKTAERRLDWNTMLVERVLRVLSYELNSLPEQELAQAAE